MLSKEVLLKNSYGLLRTIIEKHIYEYDLTNITSRHELDDLINEVVDYYIESTELIYFKECLEYIEKHTLTDFSDAIEHDYDNIYDIVNYYRWVEINSIINKEYSDLLLNLKGEGILNDIK